MCFSASASFTASGVLGLLGAVSLLQVRTKKMLPLALIPCFFSFQQGIEGLLWLGVFDTNLLKNIFLFFAFFLWPIWFPFTVWAAEVDPKRKKILQNFVVVGLITGLGWASQISSTVADTQFCTIRYLMQPLPGFYLMILQILYLFCTLICPFFSTLKSIKVVTAFAAVITAIVFWVEWTYFISIWCFLMSLVSVLMIGILCYEPSNRAK